MTSAAPRAREAIAVPAPGERLGDFEVEGELGRGGHGVVLAVRDDTGRALALKLLAGERPDAAARLRREARALEALGGEHMPRVVTIDETDDGRSFLVMERLEGETLAARLERREALEVDEACALALQLCLVLDQAHRRGIVHRDLKPSNLFLCEDGTLKVLDFGIAKVIDAEIAVEPTLTATGAMLGSPRYMAPEQIRDAKAVDPRCDLWAVGVVLHEMLSGRPCFDASTAHGLCAQIAADDPAPLPAHLPEALRRLVDRCLAKTPRDRPASAVELAESLAPFCDEAADLAALDARATSSLDETLDPGPSKPPSVPPPRRRGLGAGLLVAAALMALGVASAWPRGAPLTATADGMRVFLGTVELPAAPAPPATSAPRAPMPPPPPAVAPSTAPSPPRPAPPPAVQPPSGHDDPLADRR